MNTLAVDLTGSDIRFGLNIDGEFSEYINADQPNFDKLFFFSLTVNVPKFEILIFFSF